MTVDVLDFAEATAKFHGGYLLHIPFGDFARVCAGWTGNAAIVTAAGRLARRQVDKVVRFVF